MRQERDPHDGPDQRREHVGLRIPRVSLRAEEFVRALTERERRTPFDQFIRRADGESDAHSEETEHFSVPDVLPAKQDLSRDKRGHKTLEEVPKLVVRVALQAE